MFFVDQVGVKAPGSPRRMTRRPLQRCAKFTALREKKTTRAPSSEERAVDAVDHNSKEPHRRRAALRARKADIQVDRRRLIAERCKSAAALAEHRSAPQRAGNHCAARVQ